MDSFEHAYSFTDLITDLDCMDMGLMCNLMKYRLQDTMCPPTKLNPEPDLSA